MTHAVDDRERRRLPPDQGRHGWFYGHYFTKDADAERPAASPCKPSAWPGCRRPLVVTAEFDPLRDEGEAYAAALQAAGGQAAVNRYDGMIHGFFDMGRWSPGAQKGIQESIRRFGEVLRGG